MEARMYDRFACMIFLFIPILYRYMGKKIIQAKRFFHDLHAYYITIYYVTQVSLWEGTIDYVFCSINRHDEGETARGSMGYEGGVQKQKGTNARKGEVGRELIEQTIFLNKAKPLYGLQPVL
jgi:hypothetical protein